jgi:hypothetical protein
MKLQFIFLFQKIESIINLFGKFIINEATELSIINNSDKERKTLIIHSIKNVC